MKTTDDVVKQYRVFLRDVVSRRSADFADFNPATGWADALLYEKVEEEKLDDKVWNAVEPLLLLSHGERVFN